MNQRLLFALLALLGFAGLLVALARRSFELELEAAGEEVDVEAAE